ncbi:MAG: cytochrome P450 [Pleurocapsa sp. MO_226.B13]|nr:cytochrome P450 [Pleurocapsa sp. MO_226.B13]
MRNNFPKGETISSIFQTIFWLNDPLEYLKYCQQKYGNIFTLNMGPIFQPQVLISEPQILKQIFSSDYDKLDSGKAANLNIDIPLIGKNAISMVSGQNHQRLRKLLKPSFHGEQIKQQEEQICNLTQKIIYKYWSDWRQSKGNYISMAKVTREISTEVIFNVVLGLNEDNDRQNKIKELLAETIDPQKLILNSILFFLPFLQIDLGSMSPWGNYKRKIEQLDRLIYAEIEERKNIVVKDNLVLPNLLCKTN